HYVQRRTVRSTVYINHGKWPDLDADGVYHQRVVFPMADRIPVPGRGELRGMRLIHTHMPDLMIVVIDEGDLVRLLEELHSLLESENKGHALGPALSARVPKRNAAQFDFPMLPHYLRRLGLEDRIGMITHPSKVAFHAVSPSKGRTLGNLAAAQSVPHWA